MRWTRLLYVTVLGLCVAGESWGVATLTRYPYPQSLGRDQVTIMWRTATPVVQRLECGMSGQPLSIQESDAVATTAHEITVTGLQPGTKYEYRISEGLDVVLSDSDKYWFKTDPGPASPNFSFFVTGDIGAELPAGQQAKTGRMIQSVSPRADFGLLTGDIIYPDGESSAYDAQLMSIWRDFMCFMPIWPSLGNHDWHVDPDQNYRKEWALPNNEHWYSFDYGNMHFIALDSQDGALYDEANQLAWLEADLRHAYGRAQWITVFYHHPGLTCTYKGNDQDIYAPLYPLFDEYKVDFVFNGHAHTYERQYPVHGNVPVDQGQNPNYLNPNGFITIVTGCGGKLKTGEPTSFCGVTAAYADERLAFTQVFVFGKTVYILTLDSNTGQIVDWVQVTKTVDVTDVAMTPIYPTLRQNVPNPFNPTTTIPFEVPTAQRVALRIYKIDGSRVADLANQVFPAGSHRVVWNGLDASGARVPSGAYICRMETEDQSWSVKMTMVR